jgi:hypothetical protein
MFSKSLNINDPTLVLFLKIARVFFLSSFNYLDLVHVRREANQATHYLAKFAIYSLTDFLWMEEIPHCIAVVVTLDVLPSFG